MESLVENGEFSELTEEESQESSSSTKTSSSEEKQSCGGSEETSKEAVALGWPMRKNSVSKLGVDDEKTQVEEGEMEKPKQCFRSDLFINLPALRTLDNMLLMLMAQRLPGGHFSVKKRSGGCPYLVCLLVAFMRTQESNCSTNANVLTKS